MQRLSSRFRSQRFRLSKVCGEMFYPNWERFVWRRHPDGLQHGGRKPTETSVTEFFLQKGEFIPQVTQKQKKYFFSSAWTFQIGQILRNKSYFLINITALSAVMSMPRHAKAYKFKRTLSQIQEPILSKKLVWVLVLSCSYSSWNQNFRRINSFVVRILVTLCENRQLSWYCNCYQSYRTGSRNS